MALGFILQLEKLRHWSACLSPGTGSKPASLQQSHSAPFHCCNILQLLAGIAVRSSSDQCSATACQSLQGRITQYLTWRRECFPYVVEFGCIFVFLLFGLFFFFCFCERQLKDPIREMLEFLVIFFVIYASGVERRRNLNNYEMQTVAGESSQWLGNSEWQQASSVHQLPGC